jgi:uncharacterized membrane protein YqaE (UPF0057 family)
MSGGGPSVAAIALAILLPPIGVWLARGVGPAFWASLVLTVFAYIPGIVFSVVAVCFPRVLPKRLLA